MPRFRIPLLNVVLFLATVATTLFAGAQLVGVEVPAVEGSTAAQTLAVLGAIAKAGLPFSASLIGILFAHEMGHYLYSRWHRVDCTLPFFIPVPFGPVGTFGAVIRIRSGLPSRRATFDIGAAGPFAGFAVALPLLVWGIAHSPVMAVPGGAIEAEPLGLVQIVRDYFNDAPVMIATGVQHYGESLVTWGVQRLVHGRIPPGMDVFLHPVAFAAWIGLFVTTLNLIPLGQLDGGHVTYALLGRRGARTFSRFVGAALLLAGLFVSWNWLLWWAITRFVVGYDHPPAYDEAPLTPGRKLAAWLALALFAATFIPIPVSL